MRAVFDATESKEGRLALSRADLLYPPHATIHLHQPHKYIHILCMETEETYREAITLFLKSSGIYSLFPMPWQDTGWDRVTSCFALCPIQSGAHYPSTLCFTAHTNILKKYPSPLLPHISVQHLLGTRSGDVTGLWMTEASDVLKLPEKQMSDSFATILITSVYSSLIVIKRRVKWFIC